MCVFETYNRVYVYCLYCPYWNYNNQCRHTVKIPMMKHIVCIMSCLKIKKHNDVCSTDGLQMVDALSNH